MDKLRVWWVPQVNSCESAFYVPVQTPEEAIKLLDTLAAYDAYQLQNDIKMDYCNIGGLEIYNEESGEWESWYAEIDGVYYDNLNEYKDSCKMASELEEFTMEVFKQIDWNEIECTD